MINDDRFMMKTLKNWDFGPDMTGDITNPHYPDNLACQCGNQLAHLVTADGSFDCQDNPNEQENSVSFLHLKEALTALRVLRPGKNKLKYLHQRIATRHLTPIIPLIKMNCIVFNS